MRVRTFPIRLIHLLAALLVACASSGQTQQERPVDRPVAVTGSSPDEALARWRELIAPHVKEALATYPDAKRRYLAGLPAGETFFVTTLLRDSSGRFEQVFILVDQIEGNVIKGRIASTIMAVEGYKRGQPQTISEADVVDWLISKADGSEEGNFVGKFLDRLPRATEEH